jgi:cyclopropane fatty-acyl-phospholipid synthase-like methyltransferase
MFLSRTRQRLKLAVKTALFDKLNLQEVTETRYRHALEDCMGFRGQWDEHRRFQLSFLVEQGLAPSHKLLEIGCGPLTGGVPIIEYLDEGNYVGVDIRDSALNLAWQEVANAGLSKKNPRLILSSSFASEELESMNFDYILSFSVLFHLNDALLNTFFSQVIRRIKYSGTCLAQINTHLEDSTWLEFPFTRRGTDEYARIAHSSGLRTKNLGTIQSLGFRLDGTEKFNEMLAFTKE